MRARADARLRDARRRRRRAATDGAMRDARSIDDGARATRRRARRRRARDARWATTLALATTIATATAAWRGRATALAREGSRWSLGAARDGATPSAGRGTEEGATGRGARGLPVGPCPLAPLAICERLNYVVIEEELRAKNAAEACARLPAGRRFLCAAARDAAATLSRAANWGDAAFAREARVVPLGGGKGRRASRAASYDHALASLCDLRMNKLCGSVVEQRFEHAAKHAELRNECEIAATLGEQWETSKEVCEAMQVDVKLAREVMEREVSALEAEFAKKFGAKPSETSTQKPNSREARKERKKAQNDDDKRRKEVARHKAEITRKRVAHEKKQVALMEQLREQCTTRLNDAQRAHLEALVKCEAHGPRLRVLREDIIATEAKVEHIVPALDRTISAVAILGATPESAEQLASAVSISELAGMTADKTIDDVMRVLGAEPLQRLRNLCTESAILGAGGGKRGAPKACPDYHPPGPVSCAQSCAAMEDAAIGRVARRDKPFALGVIAGIAIGYILFAKFSAHEVSLADASKTKRE